jgi:hypothetical protein
VRGRHFGHLHRTAHRADARRQYLVQCGVAAQSVKKSDSVFGALYRRMRSRQGPAQATVSTAHAIARVVYRMLKYQVEYETISVNEYDAKRLLHLEEVRRTASQVFEKESRETRLPTRSSRSRITRMCGCIKRRPGGKTPCLRLTDRGNFMEF